MASAGDEGVMTAPVIVHTYEPGTSQTVSVAEAAQAIGIGERTLYQMIRENRSPFPIIKAGRRIRISRRRLAAFIEGVEHLESEAS